MHVWPSRPALRPVRGLVHMWSLLTATIRGRMVTHFHSEFSRCVSLPVNKSAPRYFWNNDVIEWSSLVRKHNMGRLPMRWSLDIHDVRLRAVHTGQFRFDVICQSSVLLVYCYLNKNSIQIRLIKILLWEKMMRLCACLWKYNAKTRVFNFSRYRVYVIKEL